MPVCLHEVSHSLTVQQQGHHIHILLRTSCSSSTSFLPCQLMWAPAGKPYGKNCTTYIEGKQLTTKSTGLPAGMVRRSPQLDDTSHVLLHSWRNLGLKSCHFYLCLFFVVSSGKAVQKWKSSDASISPLSYLRKVILLSICEESKRSAALLVPLSSFLSLATSSNVGCDFAAL